MRIIGSYEAKTHLPELLRQLEQGKQIVITQHGIPLTTQDQKLRQQAQKVGVQIWGT